MSKLLLGSAIAGIVFLLIPTAWLAFINWDSEKVQGLIVTSVFLGIASAFVSLFSFVLTKPIPIRQTFASSILIDSRNHQPPMILNITDNPLTSRYSRLSSLASSLSSSEGEMTAYTGELMQYLIFKTMDDLQHRSFTVAQINGSGHTVSNAKSHLPFHFSSVKTNQLETAQILNIIKDNRFSKSQMETYTWENMSFGLPSNVTMRFGYPKKDEKAIYFIELSRPNYFTSTISIEASGTTGIGSFPAGVDLSPESKPATQTYYFDIELSSEFDRLTSLNRQSQELQAYMTWLFEGLKERLSD